MTDMEQKGKSQSIRAKSKVAKGFADSKWVGPEVFRKIFAHRDFGKAVKNTLLLNILDLIFSFPMPVILALILNEIRSKWFKKVLQTLLYLLPFPFMGNHWGVRISIVFLKQWCGQCIDFQYGRKSDSIFTG